MGERDRNVFGTPGLRLVQAYMMLSTTGRVFSLTRLTELLHCSRQTVMRLMEQLACIPDRELETWLEDRERFYRMSKSAQAASMQFTPSAIRHLTLCRDIVEHLLPVTVREELHEALDPVPSGATIPNRPSAGLVEPLLKGYVDYTPFEGILEDAQVAMQRQRLCRITYAARSSGASGTHLVAPLRIIAYRDALYLRCRRHGVDGRPTADHHTFAVHRVRRLEVDGATFHDTPDEDRDPGFGFPIHDPIRVRVAFRGGAASYVAERVWSPDQEVAQGDDGSLVLTFTATSRFEVMAWVLGFGPEAELLEPTDLRVELRERIHAMAGCYISPAA